MNISQRHIFIGAALVLPLAALGIAWRLSPADGVAPVGLIAHTQVTVQSGGLDLPTPLPEALRSPLEESIVPLALGQEVPVTEDESEKESPGTGFCVLVTNYPKQLGDPGQVMVRITRRDPQIPVWSQDAWILDHKAQFGELPEGTFRVELVSDLIPRSPYMIFDWPSTELEESRQLEFDPNKATGGANEKAAIATLRSLAAAQQQVQASCTIDTDGDGAGQYAFLAEMAGSTPLRVYGPAGGQPGGPADTLDPPFLASAFGNMQAAGQYGCVLRKGYYFRVHLPAMTPSGDHPVAAVLESPQGGVGSGGADPDLGEKFWGAYAWPVDSSYPDQATFFINQEGDVSMSRRQVSVPYGGLHNGPAFDAALWSKSPGDMRARIAFAAMGLSANDHGIWTKVGN